MGAAMGDYVKTAVKTALPPPLSWADPRSYHIPIVLSPLPGAGFWISIHFLSIICLVLPVLAFSLETLATCAVEVLSLLLLLLL